MIHPLVVCLATFLIGSIPFGLLVARLFQVKDLRGQGSGNIGATNVTRVLGFWPAGAVTLLLDVLKSAIPVALLMAWAGQLPIALPPIEGLQPSLASIWWAGLCAVLGHCYSPWLHFKGGKGVATGLGVIALLSPWAALLGAVAFGVTFARTRIGSLSSLAGLIVAAIAHLVIEPIGAHLWAGALLVFVIVLRHGKNIDALLEGRENRF
jgi:glycerol-3-phosphate acyltransferase PlsY